MKSRNSAHFLDSVRAYRGLSLAGCASLFLFMHGAILAGQQSTGGALENAPHAQPAHLTLAAAVQLALQHNRHIALAKLAVHDSEEQKRIAQSHFYPNLSNQSSVLHITELEGVVIPPGAFAHGGTAGLVPSQTVVIDQGAATTYTSGTGLTQPMTQAFKIHAGVEAANADLNSAKIQSSDAENAISLQVHQLYYDILIEQQRGEAAQAAVDAAEQVEQDNSRGVAEGHLLEDAELLSRTDLLDKQQGALVSHLALDDLMLQLDDALGSPLGTKYILDSESLGDLSALPTRSDATAQLLGSNPKVLVARQTVEKAKAGVAAARDEYIPNITGIARFSYQDGLPFFARTFGTFGAMVTYDLFNGGAREASLKDARIKLTMAQTDLEQTEDDAVLELSSAYDKVEQLQQLLTVTKQALDARQETLRIKISREKATAELASTVASARSAVAAARMNMLNAQLNLYLAQNNIQRMLGKRPD
jgi:outer membrane protein TolC